MNVLLKESGAVLGEVPWHPAQRSRDGKIKAEKVLKPVRIPDSCWDAKPLIPVVEFDVVEEFVLADVATDAFNLPDFTPAPLLSGLYASWKRERGL